ncbi:MAG TPA: carbohydrate ABC transporter permease [Spirochaetia bacterium]|nr:carbohydrate ABC transporter permease [Spirochaetia bacterium]
MIESRRTKALSRALIHTVMILFSLICVVPLIAVVSVSLSSELSIKLSGYSLLPVHFDAAAYRYIFRSPWGIVHSYGITFAMTATGTFLSLLVISLLAFPLSRPDYRYRNKVSFFVFFTMLFNGGLVPWYILIVRYLQLKNHFLVLVLPYLVVPWFVLLLRTFFKQLPMSLFESAKIDGASEFRSFFQILLPLSKPALATIGLFICLNYWNDWWLALLYIDEERLVPLQYMLYRMMSNITFLTSQMSTTAVTIDLSTFPNESARMAMCVLAAGPMLFIFPFFQKYFVRGLTAGSLKG